MNTQTAPSAGAPIVRRRPRFPLRAQIASLATIAVGSGVLVGWQVGSEALMRVLPGAAPMMPLTAVCFVLSGLALALLRPRNAATEGESRWRAPVGRTMGAIVGLVGLVTLSEYLLGWNLSLETWLHHDAVMAASVLFPGRMAGATALGFVLVAAALLATDPRGRWRQGPAHFLGLAAGLNGLLAFEGYLFGAETLYRVVPFSSMAVHTAALFIVLGLGILFAAPTRGLMGVAASPQLGGAMARRVLPWVVTLPIVLGWLQQRGAALGLFDDKFGLALFAAGNIGILATIVWYSARSLNDLDAGRDRAQQDLRRSAEDLRAAQQRAEASEERLRLAVTAGGIGTWHLDLVRNELSWSDTCRELFRLPADGPMSYERFISLLHPDDRVATANAIREALDARSGYEIEHRGLMPDGSARWFASKGRAFCDETGRPVRLEGVLIDIDRRKRAEDTARAARSSLEAAQVRAQLGSWDHDLLTGRITWSHEMYRLFGCDPAFSPPDPDAFLNLLHPDCRPIVQQNHRAMLAGMASARTELRTNPERGPERWLESTTDLIRDPSGRVVAAAGTMLDITDRKRAEQEVRQLNAELEKRVEARTAELAHATAQLGAVLDAATQVSIIATDTEGLITVFNAGAERMLGYSAAEIVRHATPVDIHLPSEIEARGRELSRECGRTIAGFDVFVEPARHGRHDERDWTYVRKDGSRLTVSLVVTSQRDADGRLTGFLGVARDITRQRAVEETLRLKSAALEAADNGVAITDLAGRVSWVNPAFTRLTGYELHEIVGKPPRMLKSGRHSREFYEHMWQTILEGHVWRGELVNRRKDGSTYFEEMTITPVRDQHGRIGHFIAIKQDVTKRKQAEDELLLAKETAESATQAKSGFLAVMSHEIRTPINGVIGMANLLLETELGAKQRRFAETIQTSAETLLTIINEILDFSKIEAGRLELEAIDCDLRALVGDCLELMAPRARSKRIELAGLVDVDVPAIVRGDSVRLRQVLNNLASNAVKFTENGEVSIRVTKLAETDDSIELRFAVRDSGIGIAPEAQKRLFQAFSQADTSTTRRFGGTGLGLAISRQLVELMHGQIGVESQPDAGSTFFFSARLGKQPPSTIAAAPADGLPTMEGARSLVVHGRETSRAFLRYLLGAWQLAPETAADRGEAIQLLREAAAAGRPFGLVVIDADLPAPGGLELARAVAHEHPPGSARLVLLESLEHASDEETIRAAGVSGVVTKPVRQSQLHDCIAAVLANRIFTQAAASAPAGHRREAAPRAERSTRILLAEDNPVNQQVALELLDKLGHTADVAANGREALEAVLREPYDVVFMDCMMPEMDGYEAATRIREFERRLPAGSPRRPVHIIAMTANALIGDREKCLAAGMNDYLTKPVRIGDLRQALKRWQGAGGTAPAATPDTKPPAESHAPVAPGSASAAPVEAPAQPGESPLVDLERLAEIGSHNPEKLRRLIGMYIKQADESVASLAQAVEGASAPEVRRIAHKWAGASAQCGVVALVPVLARLEHGAQAGDLSHAAEDAREAAAQWSRAREFLDFYVKTV
jgi:PAS domain S-box-containing protein